MGGALPVLPVVPVTPASPISLSGYSHQLWIPIMPQSHPGVPMPQSIIPVYVPQHYGMHHHTVAWRFLPPPPPDSQIHLHYHDARPPAVSNKTRRDPDNNGSRNAMNIAMCFQNKDSKYSRVDNENI